MITICNDRKFYVSWKIKDMDGSLVNLRNADPTLYLLGCGRKEEISFEFVDDNTIKACIQEGLPIGVYSMLLNWTNSNCIPRHSLKKNAFAITDIPNEEDIPVNYSQDIIFAYSEADLGWITGKYKVQDATYILVELKKEGRVMVKADTDPDGNYPKVFVSPIAGPVFILRFASEAIGKYIQVCCSEEPVSIKSSNTLASKASDYLEVSTDYLFMDTGETTKYFDVISNTTWTFN